MPELHDDPSPPPPNADDPVRSVAAGDDWFCERVDIVPPYHGEDDAPEAITGYRIIRPLDLLVLTVELRNLELVPGPPAHLRKLQPESEAHVVLWLPPQSIVEESENSADPNRCLLTRSAHPHGSRLVFAVTEDRLNFDPESLLAWEPPSRCRPAAWRRSPVTGPCRTASRRYSNSRIGFSSGPWTGTHHGRPRPLPSRARPPTRPGVRSSGMRACSAARRASELASRRSGPGPGTRWCRRRCRVRRRAA